MAHKAVVVGCHILKLLKNEFGDKTREPTERELEIVDKAFNFIRNLCNDDEEDEFSEDGASEQVQESEDFLESDDGSPFPTAASITSSRATGSSHTSTSVTKSTFQTKPLTSESAVKTLLLSENLRDWKPKPFISGREVSLETMEKIVKLYRTPQKKSGKPNWKAVCGRWRWMAGRRSYINRFEKHLEKGCLLKDVMKEISEGLYNYIRTEQLNKRLVRHRDLRRVVSEINNDRINFTMSPSWLCRFRKSYGLKPFSKNYELIELPKTIATTSSLQQVEASSTTGSIADEQIPTHPFDHNAFHKHQAGSSWSH